MNSPFNEPMLRNMTAQELMRYADDPRALLQLGHAATGRLQPVRGIVLLTEKQFDNLAGIASDTEIETNCIDEILPFIEAAIQFTEDHASGVAERLKKLRGYLEELASDVGSIALNAQEALRVINEIRRED